MSQLANTKPPVVLAIGAHPDDIEFMMAGTLLQLQRAGCEAHYMNVSTGSCGSLEHSAPKLRVIRRKEAQAAARLLGSCWHPSLTDELEILYDVQLLRRLTALVRDVKPGIVLTHATDDYMEDHINTCRLAVTAVFVRGAPNFRSQPSRKAFEGDTTLYHSMPNGLRNQLRRRVIPGAYVNTTPVQDRKMAALAEHKSQQGWLDSTQKMNSYLATMEGFSREVGRMSRKFEHAEGWRRHMHYGYCQENADPLKDWLGKDCLINQAYERALENGCE